MSRYLLYGRFKWLKNVSSVWCKLNQWKIPIGYILKVNLEYREELNVLHNDYPLAPEKLAIPYEILSDYRKKIADRYGIKVGDVMKWNPNLGHKTNKVLHSRNLQLYLSSGMKLNKIHKVLKFK